MNVNANFNSANGGRGRRRDRSQGHRQRKYHTSSSNRSKSVTNVNRRNHSNENDETNEHDRDEFIATFQLNILSSSSPILVRNGITKLGDNCYSARLINTYFQNTNPHKVDIHIKQIWKVHNVGHYAKFMQNGYDEVDNMLLWHGTSRRNLVSILQNNLKLPDQATHGHMFGPGIYFADRMSKSAGYTDKSGPEVFLLCQVALGKKYRVYHAQNLTSAPRDYNTLKAVGRNVPDISGQQMLGKYCKVPCGMTVEHRDITIKSMTQLQYNEYIVFDQDRIRIKFILHCERGSSGTSVTSSISTGTANNQNYIKPNSVKPKTSTIKSSNHGTTSISNYPASSSRPNTATAGLISFGTTSGSNYPLSSTRPNTATAGMSGYSTTSNSNYLKFIILFFFLLYGLYLYSYFHNQHN